jgi:hypothetical protein
MALSQSPGVALGLEGHLLGFRVGDPHRRRCRTEGVLRVPDQRPGCLPLEASRGSVQNGSLCQMTRGRGRRSHGAPQTAPGAHAMARAQGVPIARGPEKDFVDVCWGFLCCTVCTVAGAARLRPPHPSRRSPGVRGGGEAGRKNRGPGMFKTTNLIFWPQGRSPS